MSQLLVANWKLNPAREKDATKLAKASDAPHVVVCPPFPFLGAVEKILRRASLGTQDMFWENEGAYTGEVSATMLKNIGVHYVIIGHSERRRWLGETDQMINKKVRAALKASLKVILCVGEPLAIRKKGLAKAKKYVASQLSKDLKATSNIQHRTSNLIVAYEPVWAIGTGRPDKPEDSSEMARYIKNTLMAKPYWLNPKVLYGGSVTSGNIARILKYKEIDGALVGGASTKSSEFRRIIKITNRHEDKS